MLRVITEIMANLVQSYIIASFVCRIYKVKKPYIRSFIFVLIQHHLAYIVVNYFFSKTPLERIVSGTIVFLIIGFFFFEGKITHQFFCGISEYFLFLFLDLIIEFILFASFVELISSLPPMEQKLLGRNLATALLFFVYIIFELFLNWKKEKHLREILVLAAGLAFIQMITLDILSRSNLNGVIENRNIITILFNVIMIGGYFVVMEMFRAIQRQQKKQAELEQISLERRYQYDYYQKAYTRSEEIRDMRHDMRNQLQAIQYLFQSEEEESRRRAEEMVNQLCEKVR